MSNALHAQHSKACDIIIKLAVRLPITFLLLLQRMATKLLVYNNILLLHHSSMVRSLSTVCFTCRLVQGLRGLKQEAVGAGLLSAGSGGASAFIFIQVVGRIQFLIILIHSQAKSSMLNSCSSDSDSLFCYQPEKEFVKAHAIRLAPLE